MSLYSWSVVAAVAEQCSISQAAYALGLTPSAVSHMVKKAEEDLGYSIFIRERNRFELTDSGKALLPYIQNYLKSGQVPFVLLHTIQLSETGCRLFFGAFTRSIRM